VALQFDIGPHANHNTKSSKMVNKKGSNHHHQHSKKNQHLHDHEEMDIDESKDHSPPQEMVTMDNGAQEHEEPEEMEDEDLQAVNQNHIKNYSQKPLPSTQRGGQLRVKPRSAHFSQQQQQQQQQVLMEQEEDDDSQSRCDTAKTMCYEFPYIISG
jgi:hypothetical protein